jgi:hypothetical protein
MNSLKRVLAAVGVGVCFLLAWLGILCLVFGLGGIIWFLGTWIFIWFIGFVAGLIVLPEVRPGVAGHE